MYKKLKCVDVQINFNVTTFLVVITLVTPFLPLIRCGNETYLFTHAVYGVVVCACRKHHQEKPNGNILAGSLRSYFLHDWPGISSWG